MFVQSDDVAGRKIGTSGRAAVTWMAVSEPDIQPLNASLGSPSSRRTLPSAPAANAPSLWHKIRPKAVYRPIVHFRNVDAAEKAAGNQGLEPPRRPGPPRRSPAHLDRGLRGASDPFPAGCR